MPGEPQQQDDSTYVKLPDGSYGKFPASMQQADIEAVLQKQYPPTKPAPTTKATYHSNPSFNSSMPNDPSRTTVRSPEDEAKSKLVAPAQDQPIPKPVQYAIEAAPMLEGGLEAGAAGKLIPFAKRAATSLVGGLAGSALGEGVGHYVGGKTGGKVGGVLGSIAGGLAGGGAFGEGARTIGNPSEMPYVGKYLPDLLKSAPEEMPYVNQGPPTYAAPYESQGPPRPPISVRRGPGEIAPESVGSAAPQEMPSVQRSGQSVLPNGGGVIQRPPVGLLPETTTPAAPPTEMPKVSSMDRLQQLIQEEGAGTSPLKKNVPLGDQLFTPPKKAPTEMPSVGQKVSDVINKNTETEAVRPLASGPQKNTPLRDITEPPAEPVTHRATVTHEGKTFGMEAANGRNMYEATQGDSAMAKQIHDLRNNDVRQAFMNAGGDVNAVGLEGQRFKVGKSSGNERTQMFDWMLQKGLTPQKILEFARKPLEAQ